jgi:ribonucleoside-diphosphate reductase alpha chain
MDINHNLVNDLKNMGLWDEVKDRIIEQQGDISAIPEIPSYLKQIYKTSFTTSPYAFIEVAARAQKWVDQALSRNMYLENRDMDEMKNVYMTAWKKGLKTTYYLHMKPRHTAEQSTTAVNKAAAIGKTGFARVVASAALKDIGTPELSPIQQSPVTVEEPVTVSAAPKETEARMPQEQSQGFAAVAGGQTSLPLTKEDPVAAPTIQQPVAPVPTVSSTTVSGKGFAAAAAPVTRAITVATSVAAPAVKSAAFVCPVDPAERAQCDACQ